ncbi:hypothetical protein [Oryza sativa Japonica Group]|uniref:Uncharacterized protein n=1 Tax=Oryza sativa subsp. japonica TaxID=39947 RepID=Q5N7T7_ORYSJ|nr:hypothetical protein [Oryza sativa Japonica Group]
MTGSPELGSVTQNNMNSRSSSCGGAPALGEPLKLVSAKRSLMILYIRLNVMTSDEDMDSLAILLRPCSVIPPTRGLRRI